MASAPGGGKAWIYSGKDGRVLQTLTAEAKTDNFGRHVTYAGDVDHDGHDDVLVGAPGNAAGGKDAGRAYLYSGKDGRKLATWTGEREGDAFGSTVAGYTPRQGHVPDGRRARRRPEEDRPRLRLRRPRRRSPASSSSPTRPAPPSATCSCRSRATSTATACPTCTRPTSPTPPKGPSTGRAYAWSGKTAKNLLTFTGETAGEGFGIGPGPAGDVDGDGRPDLVMGAWQYAGGAVSGGRTYLYSGKDGKLLKTYTCRIPGDTFGFDAVGMGDTDGDGTVDLLITSAWSGIKGNHSGRILLISSGVQKAAKAP